MILNPAIIALILSSLASALYGIYASVTGISIIKNWDIKSGSEQQLLLERKTHLVSTVLTVLFGLSGFTLILFVHTADHIHPLFTGAMCAAGSLNVNRYGYPALITQLIVICLCAVWLILNFVDSKAPDYPLIKIKYKLLIFVTFFLVFKAYFQSQYFLNLKANVLTTCCGVIFSGKAAGIPGQVLAMPPVLAKILFYLSAIAAIRAGIHFYHTGKSAVIFAWLSALLLLASLIAILSFISVYFYEMPTHHCPFCLLHKEYNYIGYPVYISLFVGAIAGIGTGILEKVKGAPSLKEHIPAIQKKLCLWAIAGFAVFTLLATYPMIFSDFKMAGF